MENESVFDWSYDPFEFKSFIIKIDDKQGFVNETHKTIYLCIGIKPIILILSTSTQKNISAELKLWKSSLAFNLRLWS